MGRTGRVGCLREIRKKPIEFCMSRSCFRASRRLRAVDADDGGAAAQSRRGLELRECDAVRTARRAGRPGVLHRRQAADFEAQTKGRNDRDRRDGGAATDAARGVADFWFDRGEHVASFNGKKRTSWVIDPPDGKVPPLTAEARARQTARNADQRDHPADGPENRSLAERCISFNAGPPIGRARTTTSCSSFSRATRWSISTR